MLKAAKKRTTGFRNVELRQGSLEALPVDDGSCDAALLLLALTYVPDPASVLAEMARILRPGGRAVVVDLLRHDREDFRREMGQQSLGFAPEGLAEMLEDAGLPGASCRELSPEAEARGPALVLAAASVPRERPDRKMTEAHGRPVEREGDRTR